MKKLVILIVFTVLALNIAGCVSVNFGNSKINVIGAGKIISLEYPCGDFDKLTISTGCKLVYTAEKSDTVKIELYENLADKVTVENVGGVLAIGMVKEVASINSADYIKIFVSAPALEEINITGMVEVERFDKISGDKLDIMVSGFISGKSISVDVNAFSLVLSGAGDITLDGSAVRADIKTSGAGSVKAFGLQTETAGVNVSGVGGIEISCSKALNASVSGVGGISYKGGAEVTKKIGGIGRVTKAD